MRILAAVSVAPQVRNVLRMVVRAVIVIWIFQDVEVMRVVVMEGLMVQIKNAVIMNV